MKLKSREGFQRVRCCGIVSGRWYAPVRRVVTEAQSLQSSTLRPQNSIGPTSPKPQKPYQPETPPSPISPNTTTTPQVFFNLESLWLQLKKLLAELLEEVRQAPLSAAGFLQGLDVNLQAQALESPPVQSLLFIGFDLRV